MGLILLLTFSLSKINIFEVEIAERQQNNRH